MPRICTCRECNQTFEWRKPGPTPVLCPDCRAAHGANGSRYVMDRKHRWHVSKTYGISPDTVDRLMARQRGVCAVCRQPPDNGERLHVDHDHSCCVGSRSCGECVRGLVCRTCNQAMGLLNDDTERIERLIKYLRQRKRGRATPP